MFLLQNQSVSQENFTPPPWWVQPASSQQPFFQPPSTSFICFAAAQRDSNGFFALGCNNGPKKWAIMWQKRLPGQILVKSRFLFSAVFWVLRFRFSVSFLQWWMGVGGCGGQQGMSPAGWSTSGMPLVLTRPSLVQISSQMTFRQMSRMTRFLRLVREVCSYPVTQSGLPYCIYVLHVFMCVQNCNYKNVH